MNARQWYGDRFGGEKKHSPQFAVDESNSAGLGGEKNQSPQFAVDDNHSAVYTDSLDDYCLLDTEVVVVTSMALHIWER